MLQKATLVCISFKQIFLKTAMTNMLRFSSFLVGEGGQERTIYFHEIKHISFHGSVFQATMKLITRALIVIVIPFWGESWRLWARRGEGGERGEEGEGSGLERNISWWWCRPIARGVIQNRRVETASEDARVAPGWHHRGRKPHKSGSPSKPASHQHSGTKYQPLILTS